MELDGKGTPVRIETLHIPPLHPMRELWGTADELRRTELARQTRGEYLRLAITDQLLTPELSNFFQRLAEQRDSVLMERVSEFHQFVDAIASPGAETVREKTLEELFVEFYTARSGGEEPAPDDLELLQEAGELLRNHAPDPKQRAAVDPALTEQLLNYLMAQEGGRI